MTPAAAARLAGVIGAPCGLYCEYRWHAFSGTFRFFLYSEEGTLASLTDPKRVVATMERLVKEARLRPRAEF